MSLNYKQYISSGIRRLRKERRWTQVEFAKLVGLSQSRFSDIERGKGSLTAEQLLLVLKTFNVSIDYFVSSSGKKESALQNALVRLGASHLQEDKDILPSEQISKVADVIRETLVSASSSRQIVSIAPVLVARAREINFNGLWHDLLNIGLANRCGWIVDNTLSAIQSELNQILSRDWVRKYRQAEVILKSFITTRHFLMQESAAEDILDADITSQKTLDAVKSSRSELSNTWHIVTRITQDDFVSALREARKNA
jgi:transcriptional regulator with XRE-family HTH domain